MKNNLDLFTFLFLDSKSNKTLCLLHGTGGDEKDLLPLAEPFTDSYNVLSIRGNVLENGMRRFFARKSLGVFDQESIKQETENLAAFTKTWMEHNPDRSENMVFLGYSNGANMILATCFMYPSLFKKIVLLHPMLPFDPDKLDMGHVSALVTMGNNDEMIKAKDSKQLVETLKKFGATVKVVEHEGGHEFRQVELDGIGEFLE